mgnify:CR=1 FL=1
MAFEKIVPEKVSDTVARQIEAQIAAGALRPGDRLPSERELASQFAVSRPSVREAIQKLVARKLLETHRGGGTTVSNQFGESFTDPLLELLGQRPETLYDLLEFRDALEGIASYQAAQRANDTDRKIIQHRYQRLIEAHAQENHEVEARADVDFHLSIAEASHNVVLLHVMRSLFDLLHRSVRISFRQLYRSPADRQAIPDQHAAIMQAVLDGDAESAQARAREHIAYVRRSLDELSRADDRSDNSLRRLQQLARQ